MHDQKQLFEQGVDRVYNLCRWPDSWVLKDPYGSEWGITNLTLQDDFVIVEKPKPVPIPETLKKWYKETLANRG
jgi:hypothetical protein